MIILRFIILGLLLGTPLSSQEKKVLICGVGRNIQHALSYDIQNMEALGAYFDDYAIIIYENNSLDNTQAILAEWAQRNSQVTLVSEILNENQLPPSRTEKIARARNRILSLARDPKFKDFKYLIMVDLDFHFIWPYEEILKSIESPFEWDCICANGIESDGIYYDRFAYRDQKAPFGPELLGDLYWKDQRLSSPFSLIGSTEWIPVYSAFGGLAIFKTESVLKFSYSGIVTQDLKKYYQKILLEVSQFDPTFQLDRYLLLQAHQLIHPVDISKVPILFQQHSRWESPNHRARNIVCCEHIPLLASMALNGFGKIFINPQLVLRAYR